MCQQHRQTPGFAQPPYAVAEVVDAVAAVDGKGQAQFLAQPVLVQPQRWPSRAAALQRALELIERHPLAVILAMRFAWGLRTALPLAIGISGVPAGRFLLLNVLSAALWALLVAGAGWLLGETLARHMQDVQRLEHWALLGLLLAAVLVHLGRRWWLRKRS